jgi:hypothetical protein
MALLSKPGFLLAIIADARSSPAIDATGKSIKWQ